MRNDVGAVISKKSTLTVLIFVSLIAIAFWLVPSFQSPQQNVSVQIDDVSQTPTTVEDEEPSTELSMGEIEVDLEQEKFNAALEQISPVAYDNYSNHYSTYIELVLGDIGRVDVEAVLAGDVTSILKLLGNRAEVTGIVPGVDLEIVEIRSNQNNHTAIYGQRVHGISFDRTSKVQFDNTGLVKRLSSTLIDPSKVEVQPTIFEPEAIAHAKSKLANDLGVYIDDIVVMGEQAIYERINSPTLYFGVNSDDELYPFWLIALKSEKQDLVRLVTVDARTGQSKLRL